MTDRKFTRARPTIYKGIQMRSRLEADYAAYLDRNCKAWDLSWSYEPTCFGSEDAQWLPDFLEESDGYRHFTELKPLGMFTDLVECSRATEIDAVLRRISVAWASEPQCGLSLVFWEYKATSPAVRIWASAADSPWLVSESESRWPHSHLWTGMGQWTAICESNGRATPEGRPS